MYDIPAMVKSISDAFSSLFGWRTSVVEKTESKEIISDKQDLERACGYADEALMFVEQHGVWLTERHARSFRLKVKKFRKYRNRP